MTEQIPLSVPWIAGNEWKYVKRCLDTGWVSSAGSFVGMFEDRVREYTRAKYAASCVNGTMGLFMALLMAGAKEDAEVVVPTVTFIAPVNAVRYAGCEPVFMDCDSHLNMDADKLNDFCARECRLTTSGLVNKKSGRTVKAVIVVHVFGNPCDMERIMAVAGRFKLKVIEDATESMGSCFTEGPFNGSFTGTIGETGVYSFNGNKIITSGGGGMIVTNSKRLSDKARYLIDQAKDDPIRYIHDEIGYNFRLSNLQAAVGVAQLERLEDFIRIKKRNYDLYKKGLRDIDGIELMGVPAGTRPNYWFYSLIVDKKRCGMDREALVRGLAGKNIQARPLWRPNHLQKPYRNNQAYRIEKATRSWKRVVNIPSSANLTEKDISRVVSEIKTLTGAE